MSSTLEKFIESEIPEDVIWRNKMIELVIKAYELGQVTKAYQLLGEDDE